MAIYDASYIGTTANRVTFNNFSGTPVYRVLSRAPQRRQLRELDIPIPFESGISDFETLVGETAYVIEGIMYPGSESDYDTGTRALRKLASLDIAQDDNLSDDGYVPYVWTEFNGQKQLFLKVLYVQLIEDTRKGLVQPFRLICKVKDPIIYGATLKTATTATVDPGVASGSAVYPFSFPIVYGASTYSVTSNAQNDGDIATYPVGIIINGPVNTPIITNSSTGESLQVNTNLATDDSVLRIAYDKDSVTVEKDGTSVLDQVTGTFFKLQPGTNEITLSGSSIDTGAYVELTYYNAYPLS